jgi:hypothetical protein
MNKKLIITIVVIIQVCFIWQCVINPARSTDAAENSSVSEGTPGAVDEEAAEVSDEGAGEQQTQEGNGQESDGGDVSGQTEPEITSLNAIEEFEQVIMEGQQEVQDTPWNVNSGLITLGDGEQCLFLTPNTGFMTPYMSVQEGTIELSFCIFEDVRDKSDGAGLLLQLHDTEGNLLKEENIPVDAGQDWQEYSGEIDAAQADKVRIRIMCNNGGNDDDVCDWVMMREARVG